VESKRLAAKKWLLMGKNPFLVKLEAGNTNSTSFLSKCLPLAHSHFLAILPFRPVHLKGCTFLKPGCFV